MNKDSGSPVPRSRTGHYAFRNNVKGAHLKVAATNSKTAPEWQFHDVNYSATVPPTNISDALIRFPICHENLCVLVCRANILRSRWRAASISRF